MSRILNTLLSRLNVQKKKIILINFTDVNSKYLILSDWAANAYMLKCQFNSCVKNKLEHGWKYIYVWILSSVISPGFCLGKCNCKQNTFHTIYTYLNSWSINILPPTADDVQTVQKILIFIITCLTQKPWQYGKRKEYKCYTLIKLY